MSGYERPAIQQRGFTLLELIVVIVIVVLVIYVGLPNFAKALRDTHETAVALNARALRDAVQNTKALALLSGVNGAVYNLRRSNNGNLDLSPAGFPSGTSRQPGDALTAQHCTEIWLAILEPNLEQSPNATLSSFTATVSQTGKTAVCDYIYTHGGDMHIRYDPNTGAVTADAHFKGFAF